MRYPAHYVPTDAASIREARRSPGFVQGETRSTKLLMRFIPASLVKNFTPGLAFLATKGSIASRTSMSRRYVIISPCRNEAEFMRQTLDTVVAQSVRPARWVIVDDGSTDDTPRILAEYAALHDWITVVTRADRGRRAVGPGVIEAFYAGYETIDPNDFDYLCKLDLDLNLPPRYFEILMQRMEAEPRLATCSGKAYVRKGDRLVNERHGDETSLGMTKFYRVALLSGDRRLRARGDVGWHRLSPLPHAGLDRPQLGRARTALRPPAADGLEPDGHPDRADAPWIRPVLHGYRVLVHAGKRG